MPEENANKPVSAFSLFSKSFDLIKEHLNVFGVLYGIPFAFTLLSLFANNNKTTVNTNIDKLAVNGNAGMFAILGGSVLLLLFGVIIYIVIFFMVTMAQINAAAGKSLDWSVLWEMVKKYALRMVGLGLAIGVLFVLGIILLIIPGLFVLKWYYLAPYHMIDKDLSISDAMKASKEQSKDYGGAIWGMLGVLLLISIVGSLGSIGNLVSTLLTYVYGVAPAIRYFELKSFGKKVIAEPKTA